MGKFFTESMNTFKKAKLLHKILYFLSYITIIFSFIFVFYMYIDLTSDLYQMYKRKNITFIFFLIWIPSSIWMIYILFYWLIEERFLTLNNLKEALFVPISISILGVLSLIAVGMFPFLIVEYWNISKIILLILLSSLAFLGLYVFVNSNDTDTIGRYLFGIFIFGIFILYPFIRSDTYNQFMAEYYLESKDYDSAIDYLKFLATESDNNYLREKSGDLVINLYLKDDNKWRAVSFAHEIDDISDYANYVIGINELESENLTTAMYYLYKASDSYAYKDAYEELKEAIRKKGEQVLSDILIPQDIFDLIPTSKIFKGAKLIKKISKGAKVGHKIYKSHMRKNIDSSKQQLKEFEKCLKYKSYDECKYELPN